MNQRYIEVDSAYRNRQLWPLPSNFQLPIAQSAIGDRNSALDPVSLAVPVFAWTGDLINATGPTGTINCEISSTSNPIANNVSALTDVGTFVISNRSTDFTVSLEQLTNYYSGLSISAGNSNTGPNIALRRITKYKFLATTGATGAAYTFSEVSVDPPLNDYVLPPPTNATISDPTSVQDLDNPLFFVPAGYTNPNSYSKLLLYNESLNQYRPVSDYDEITRTLKVVTTGAGTSYSGPVTGWQTTDNFNLRRELPMVPALSVVNPTIQNATVTTTDGSSYTTGPSIAILSLSAASYLNTTTGAYKNCGLRIIPNNSRIVAPGTPQYYSYIYNRGKLLPPLNESTVIANSFPDATNTYLILPLYPGFTTTPANLMCEICEFSYDNAHPFIYQGSMVSQTQDVSYEIKLLNVVLPNKTLATSLIGGRVAFYPYVYVHLSNLSNGTNSNSIYSNNPNARNMIFRCPVYDVSNPDATTFVNMDGDGMDQTMKFKPNDNLSFSVRLPNGELYQTAEPESYSPAPPNPFIQISAAFSIRRIQ